MFKVTELVSGQGKAALDVGPTGGFKPAGSGGFKPAGL